MPVYNIARIIPEPDDNRDTFGAAIAINQNYLAVGDYDANRVIIYTRDNSGQWIRSKEVLPPKNSLPERVGSGFGEQVQLEGNFLLVTALVMQQIKDVTNPEEFTTITGGSYVFNERYLVNLEDLETEPQAVGMPMQKNEGMVTFNLFSEGKMIDVTLPNRGEASFGASFAHHKNLLLVGSPSATEERGAWLYNLDELNEKPEKLAAPGIYIGNTVALSEHFAVVGEHYYQTGAYRPWSEDAPNQPKSTLIRVNKTGSTRVQQFRGRVSLSDDILAVIYPTFGYFTNGAVVEVHGLSSAGVSFLSMRGNVANAFVQNGFLVTVLPTYRLGYHEIHIQELVWN